MKKTHDKQGSSEPVDRRRKRRLELRSEVLRNLTEEDLARAAGGRGGCWYSDLTQPLE
jgi:hypothetical protein